ncbi:MAG TPA: hypothetical protein EYP55_00990 [Anaerolineae bacterium]|nr:hypothetical protein [Anaerolineae bacterium]
MTKKSRRARRKARKKRRIPRPVPRGVSAPAPVAPAARRAEVPQEAALPGRRTAADFREQYHHVYQDLKRIAILAGAIFAMLIILSFVLR